MFDWSFLSACILYKNLSLLPWSGTIAKNPCIDPRFLVDLGWMNGIICCQEPTSEIIRVEKQFSRLRFKCRTTFFLGFKIDADVAPHYIIYMRLCTIHVEINYEIARFPRRFKSPILLSSGICLLRTRWLRPFFICLLLSVSGDACLRVIWSSVAFASAVSLT